MTTILRVLIALIIALAPGAGALAQDAASTTATETISSNSNSYTVEKIEGDIDVGDFVVGPGRTELSISPGETVTEYILVTNRISDSRVFTFEVDDISGSSDGSAAVKLADGERGPYSIRDYISFPQKSITLNLGERARVPVVISLPLDAEPGGLYGSVLVTTDRSSTNEETGVRAPLIARIGSLFFVTVEGDAERGGQTLGISTLDSKWWYERGPVNLGIGFENTGSIHLNPYGELSIKNMFGEEVGFIQLEPWFVLPQSLRTREIAWDREFLFGRYTVTAKINRGYDDVVDEVSTTFWVLPWKIVLGVFLSIFVLVFGIRTFFRTFEFKRK